MANEEHLKILKQGVEVWNKWRGEIFSVKHEANLSMADLRKMNLREAILLGADLKGADLREATLFGADLRGADLREAKLYGTDLRKTNLRGANLCKANLREANLDETYLRETRFCETNLRGANLCRTNLQGVNLCGVNLCKANLREANLREANLSGADLNEAKLSGASLIKTNLSQAIFTGAELYGTARDDWTIDGILCDFVYWDEERERRFPKDRDFRPGEFEELYTQLPTFEYYFEQSFTPLDPLIMDRVVQAINERHKEFHLELVNFDKRGQPHAVFTVLHKEHVEVAQKQVTNDYESRIAALEGKQEQMMELISKLMSKDFSITAGGDVIITDIKGDVKQLASGKEISQRTSQAGRDYLEQVAGDVTTGESVSEPKEKKSGESYGDAAPAEGQTNERSDPS